MTHALKRLVSPADLERLRKNAIEEKAQKKTQVIISSEATCCDLKGSVEVCGALEGELENRKDVELIKAGCLGFCEVEPLIIIRPAGIFYPSVTVDSVKDIVARSVDAGEVIEELLFTDPASGKRIAYEEDIPFYKKQKRILLTNNSHINPTKITDYLATGGYTSLKKALIEMTPEKIIDEVKKSGLRGRGGAGFPTGTKWEIARKQPSPVKYIICNADEGDPGAYMNRSTLESNPHSVIEGMIIGAYAIGAPEGWIYVRHEYPLAINHLTIAIDQARELGLIGKNILGSGFDFDIKMAKGAGSFVCGEETALIASIEGRRGVPQQRPPFPAQHGLFGKPTNINNVETWSDIPLIVERGGEWYSSIGTEKSKGTKIFSLVGKVRNTGLVEVPMGTTLKEVVFDIGGGAPGGKKVKGVQIGGPSGGCVPASLFTMQIDYDSLKAAGTIMGSGGMIVMDEETCMVDIAKYFMKFLKEESCGKCVTCREGTQRMHEILVRISDGKGRESDLALLEELGKVIRDASMCGLGQTAPTPVLSTLRYFSDEYAAHIHEGRCPAKVCKPLIRFEIDAAKCTGCLLCLKQCPEKAIVGELKKPHSIIAEKCVKCGICQDVCRFDAVLKKSGRESYA